MSYFLILKITKPVNSYSQIQLKDIFIVVKNNRLPNMTKIIGYYYGVSW